MERCGGVHISRDTVVYGGGNSAPAFTGAMLVREVAENSPAGTAVGAPVPAADPNGDPVTYSIEGPAAALFSIDSGSGQIATVAALDYEVKTSHALIVRATDDWGGSGTAEVEVRVTDVTGPADPPTVIPAVVESLTATLDGAVRGVETVVTVSAAVAPGSGAANVGAIGDFDITVAVGQASATEQVLIEAIDDRVDEPDEVVRLTGRAAGLSVTGTAFTIADDDVRGVVVSHGLVPVTEGTVGRSYTLRLATKPTADVTVTPEVLAGSGLSFTPASVVFTAANWETPQSVTVRAAHDGNTENEAVAVVHATAGGDYADFSRSGGRSVGDQFFIHVINNRYDETRVQRIAVTPIDDERRSFEELPENTFDRSDRKFLAVAVSAEAVVLNATDSDWGEQRELMDGLGVKVEQLCPQHASKGA